MSSAGGDVMGGVMSSPDPTGGGGMGPLGSGVSTDPTGGGMIDWSQPQSSFSPSGTPSGIDWSQAQVPAEGGSASQAIVGATGGDPSLFGGLGGVLHSVAGFADMIGKTPEERIKNMRALTAAFKNLNDISSTMRESTLLQRLYEQRLKHPPFTYTSPERMDGGQIQIPKTFDPSVAGHIMSQMGFK